MKRSEANQIKAKIIAFSTEYPDLSMIDEESFFSRSGCDCCDGGGNNVYTCNAMDAEGLEYEVELCSQCLCAIYNDDFSFLDYYVTDENN
jgi:hypothetical protein